MKRSMLIKTWPLALFLLSSILLSSCSGSKTKRSADYTKGRDLGDALSTATADSIKITRPKQ